MIGFIASGGTMAGNETVGGSVFQSTCNPAMNASIPFKSSCVFQLNIAHDVFARTEANERLAVAVEVAVPWPRHVIKEIGVVESNNVIAAHFEVRQRLI